MSFRVITWRRSNIQEHQDLQQSHHRDVTFAASGRSKSLKNTVILLILCQKCKRLRVYTLHNSKKAVTAD